MQCFTLFHSQNSYFDCEEIGKIGRAFMPNDLFITLWIWKFMCAVKSIDSSYICWVPIHSILRRRWTPDGNNNCLISRLICRNFATGYFVVKLLLEMANGYEMQLVN